MAKKPKQWKMKIRTARNGLLEMVTTFVYNDNTMREIAKINEKGETDYNGLLYNMFGYFGDTDGSWTDMKWGGYEKEKNVWRKPCFYTPNPITKKEVKLILKKYPKFSYVLKKLNNQWRGKSYVFFLLYSWLLNPYTEFLVERNLYNLIGDKNFNRLSNRNKKAVLKEIEKKPELKFETLKYIQLMKKYNLTHGEVSDYFNVKLHYCKSLTLKDMKYLQENEDINVIKYSDYLEMLPRAFKNPKDEYWRHPKDFDFLHERLVRMVTNIEEKNRSKADGDRAREFYTYGKTFRKLPKEIEGYEIYVPTLIEDLREHAKNLAQCLVSCSYDKKMAERRCILIFIKKKGESVATVELNNQLETVQFYADEHNRAECHPNADVKKAFETWKKELLIWNRRINKEKRKRA